MKLYRLLERIEYNVACGTTDRRVTTVVHDSSKVIPDSVFVCIKGNKADGHDYVKQVIKQGACVIVAERLVEVPDDVTLILVTNTRIALAYMAAAYYDYPAEKLTTIGITGTKGKTTTSYMVRGMLEYAGVKTGLIGTIEVLIGDLVVEAYNTTPDSLLLQQYLSEMVDAGMQAVVMEVSSQGLMLERVAGLNFDYGIFTNISPDHIGPAEHKTYEEYRECKSKLFRQCKVGIVNEDCKELPYILKNHSCSIETYGLHRTSLLYAYQPSLLQKPGYLGIQFYLGGAMNSNMELWMPGLFNIYNALAAISVARHFNMTNEMIREALANVKVKGRLELVEMSPDYTVMIDYAHNAVSLKSVLTTVRQYRPKRIVCMFGCGGNRAKARRYEMGKVAAMYADQIVVTSDNPRDEDMEQIADDIVVGIEEDGKEYVRIINRHEAIRYCLEHAERGDVIILAGKGHETYQEIKGIRYHMDEREILAQLKSQMEEGNQRLMYSDIFSVRKEERIV